MLTQYIHGSAVQAERGAQAIADLADTEAAVKARARRGVLTKAVQKGGVLYADEARKMKRKRITDEHNEAMRQQRILAANLRSKWKVFKKRSRKALCVAIRGRGKDKPIALRPLTYDEEGNLLPGLPVFNLANLQHNSERISNPVRKENHKDSNEEQYLSKEYLHTLYPHKYAAIEQKDASRAYRKVSEHKTLPSSPPSIAAAAPDDLTIDPALLTQYT